MFIKLLKALFLIGFTAAVILVVAYFGGRYILTEMARDKAQEVLADASDGQWHEIVEVTRAVHERFKPDEPSKYWALRLRPIVTNKMLPAFLRYQDGVIETLVETGLCDNAARYLQFVLAQRGYESVQWNMVTDNRAHSILLVYLDGNKTAVLDPMFGIIGYDQEGKSFLSPFEIREKMNEGASLNDVFFLLDDHADTEFYKDFASVRMGALGDVIRFYDGRAKRSFERMNSYINIDQIAVYPR